MNENTVPIENREDATTPAEESVPVRYFLRFPAALYFDRFGFAVFGYGLGVAVERPSQHSLIALGVGAVVCIVAFFLMRPYMRVAKSAIATRTAARFEPLDAQNDPAS
jgi:hypothetical protein